MLEQYSSLYDFPNLYADGCSAVVESGNLLQILKGAVRDHTNSLDIENKDIFYINSLSSGLGGLDVGIIEPSKLYYVYLISDVSGKKPTGGMLSLSITNPVLPTVEGVTYNAWRVVDFVCTDENSDFIKAKTHGSGNLRYKSFSDNQVLIDVGSSTTLTTIDLGRFVPLNLIKVQLYGVYLPEVNNGRVVFYEFSNNRISFDLIGASGINTTGQFSMSPRLSGGKPKIQYQNIPSGAVHLEIVGVDFFI